VDARSHLFTFPDGGGVHPHRCALRRRTAPRQWGSTRASPQQRGGHPGRSSVVQRWSWSLPLPPRRRSRRRWRSWRSWWCGVEPERSLQHGGHPMWMPVHICSHTVIAIEQSHAQIESASGRIDSDIQATDTSAEQFITDTGVCVDAQVGKAGEAVGGLDSHRWCGVEPERSLRGQRAIRSAAVCSASAVTVRMGRIGSQSIHSSRTAMARRSMVGSEVALLSAFIGCHRLMGG
jgi:hypothetical protein